jgi:hypothetical protein
MIGNNDRASSLRVGKIGLVVSGQRLGWWDKFMLASDEVTCEKDEVQN